MTHSQTVTQVRRCNRYVTSDFALKNQMMEDFARDGGASSLSAALGISEIEAVEVLAGRLPASLNRLAFHFGFMPDEKSTGWRILPMDDEPADSGPPMRWTRRLMEYLNAVLSNGAMAPSVRHLAWRMDTTETRLRRAMKLHGIKVGTN